MHIFIVAYIILKSTHIPRACFFYKTSFQGIHNFFCYAPVKLIYLLVPSFNAFSLIGECRKLLTVSVVNLVHWLTQSSAFIQLAGCSWLNVVRFCSCMWKKSFGDEWWMLVRNIQLMWKCSFLVPLSVLLNYCKEFRWIMVWLRK